MAAVIILGLGLALAGTGRLSGSGGTVAKSVPSARPSSIASMKSQDQPVPDVSLAGLRWSDFYGVEDQASQSEGVAGDRPLGNVDVTEEAFRWVAYTPEAAIIDLVSAGPGSQGSMVRASTQMEVIWASGDWKVVAPPGGDWGNSAAELSSLSGYTIFPGQEGGH